MGCLLAFTVINPFVSGGVNNALHIRPRNKLRKLVRFSRSLSTRVNFGLLERDNRTYSLLLRRQSEFFPTYSLAKVFRDFLDTSILREKNEKSIVGYYKNYFISIIKIFSILKIIYVYIYFFILLTL